MHLFRVSPAFAAVCLCAFSLSPIAQTRVLPAISFAGAPGYSQAELLAFTGLKPGGAATQQQLDDAAQHLNDTGLFDEVNFTGNDKGIVYSLKPAPPSAMLPVRFSNFVWWPDEEIQRALKTRVALYRPDAVPTAGNLRGNIAVALKAMLAEKGVGGTVVGSRLSSSRPNGPLDHIVFAIDSPAVLIHSLTLTGASPEMQSKLEPVIHDVAGQQWDKDASFGNIGSRVGDVYHNQGYLDIALVKQEHSEPNITANDIRLDLSATLSEGAQYHVAQLAWAGSDMMSTADFNKHASLKVGDPDSPIGIWASLKSLTDAYGAKGYIDAKASAPPVVDRATHQVAYMVSVEHGPQYHFGSIRWPSLSTSLTKEFDATWKMKPGDVYDSTYLIRFLSQTSLMKQGFTPNITEKRDPAALTVDLSVTFKKPAEPPPQ